MLGGYEQHEANIATTAGFPGVYPCAALATHSPTTAQAISRGNPGKDNTELVDGENGRVLRPDSITAGLPDVGQRFEEVAEVEKIYGGDDVGNTGPPTEGGREISEVPFDPASLPDDDYLDLMFGAMPKEDRVRLSTGQTQASLLRELLPDLPATDIPGHGPQAGGQAVRDNETVPMSISDDDYMDQMFVPLPPEDKLRLSANQTRESLFRELLGPDIVADAPSVCEGSPHEDVPSKSPAGNPNAAGQYGPKMANNETREAYGAGVCAQVPHLMVCNEIPPQSQGGIPHRQDAEGEVARVSKAPHQQSQDNPPGPVKRAKRKRSSGKRVAKSAQGGQPRPKKRRRTRVEDMDPADVHVCDYEGCGKRFARRYNLTVHQRAHRNEYPFRCDVPDCGKPFMWHSSLSRHLRVHDKGGRSGGRKQRRKARRTQAPSKNLGEHPSDGAQNFPGVSQKQEVHKLETIEALVSTVSFDQTIMVLLGGKHPKIEKDVDVKAHLEDRCRQFAYRQQQLVGMWNSPIVMSREIFLRMCTEILGADRMETDA